MTKDRILKLVEQGVITMEEAVRLLEMQSDQQIASDQATSHPSESLITQLKDLQDKEKALAEQLTIIQEQLRECQIAVEIGMDIEASKKRQSELLAKQKQVQSEHEALEPQIVNLEEAIHAVKRLEREGKRQQRRQERNDWVNDKVLDPISEMARTAMGTLKDASEQVSDLFQMREIGAGVSIPWLKQAEASQVYDQSIEGCQSVAVHLLNGKLTLRTHPKPTVYAVMNIREYGSESVDLEAFDALNPLVYDTDAHALEVVCLSPRYYVDATVYLPDRVLEQLTVQLYTDDLSVQDVKAKRADYELKTGRIDLNQVTHQQANIHTMNSDIDIQNSAIGQLDLRNMNGDLRYQGAIGHVQARTINGSLILTKTDRQSANMVLNTTSGDIKVSLPKGCRIEGTAESRVGSVAHRLSQIELDTEETPVTIQRKQGEGGLVQLDLQVLHGDILLKDNE